MKVRVGSRGTIVIPKEIRDKSGIVKGDVLEISLKGKAIVLTKDTRWERFHGCAEGLITAEKIEKELDENGQLPTRHQRIVERVASNVIPGNA